MRKPISLSARRYDKETSYCMARVQLHCGKSLKGKHVMWAVELRQQQRQAEDEQRAIGAKVLTS